MFYAPVGWSVEKGTVGLLSALVKHGRAFDQMSWLKVLPVDANARRVSFRAPFVADDSNKDFAHNACKSFSRFEEAE